MNWITTSGRTLDEAKGHALDQLGIVADEAEFDVVNDVEKGLFGRVKTEAKIRARVRPKPPAVKDERQSRNGGRSRSRSRNSKKSNNGNSNRGQGSNQSSSQGSGKKKSRNQNSNGRNSNKQSNSNKRDSQNNQGNRNNGAKDASRAAAAAAPAAAAAKSQRADSPRKQKKEEMETTITREEQIEHAETFLNGVLDSFGLSGDVSVVEEMADDEAIELSVSGSELGLLVGRKGATLSALQELTRTVVQRNAEGAKTDRLRVDVAGYRALRTAKLREFAQQISQDVLDSGDEKLLEPMAAADRKVVHDAVNDIEGVETGSEGEEPRRRVVIRPVS